MWFNSYLFNRKQYCRVRGFDSDISNVDVGAPHGSCLGPMLFLIDTNDLPKFANASTVSMYADDTNLTFSISGHFQFDKTINDDLKQLNLWMEGSKLSLNVLKT